jgi:uncharacterized protein (TIGR03437 family)
MKNLIYPILALSAALSAPVWAQTAPTINQLPTREFGQPQLLQTPNTAAPNYVEGRELYEPGSVALDTTSSPPILYVADTLNNRVLAWQNPGNPATCGTNNPTCGFANLVIGQRDLFSTLPLGPASQLSAGLSLPSAVAVDGSGNLYVADVGNNRVLRFPAPFKQPAATQPGALFVVDLVIGQTSVSSGNQSNQGLSAPTASTLALTSGSSASRTGLALNPTTGDLWVTDPGNNRILGFPKANLAPNTSPVVATMVLGQSGFTTSNVPTGVQNKTLNPGNLQQLFANVLYQPASLAFDQKGRLYVADDYSRVLFFDFTAGFFNGMSATDILGVNQLVTQTTPTFLPYPNQYTLGMPVSSTNTSLQPPQGVFTLGNNVFVCDTYANRIVEYDQPQNWPAPTVANPSPAILSTNLIGQVSLTVFGSPANKGQASPDATTLSQPVAGVISSTDSSMWVADLGNNRVLRFPSQSGAYQTASAVIGQLDFPYNAPNLIEGTEVFFFAGGSGAAGMVIDPNSTPPHLYIADTENNRILGFKDYRTVQQGSKADLVIGQPSLFTSIVNYPIGGNVPQIVPQQQGLFKPIGLVVDSSGNLYVADSGNGRVVRFAPPFSQPSGQPPTANLVLGQPGFTTSIKNASPQNMSSPWGLALFSDGSLAVSDAAFNRVLIFKHPAGADFTNGQAASIVLGQQDFISTQPALPTNSGGTTTPASVAGMNQPAHIATDTSDRLYVCDSQNSRLLIFTDARIAANGVASVFQQTNLSDPQGVIVSPITGEIWIANTNQNQVLRLSSFASSINGPQITATITAPLPLGLTLDPASNVIVADAYNRVTFYYALLAYQNAANFNSNPLAPGMIALLYRFGSSFGTPDYPSATAPTLPWPPVLSDIQVLVNNLPAPIYSLNPAAGFIAFQVPFEAPTSGNATFIVTHQSTGEILATASIQMAQQNPGFLTRGPGGSGQVAAFNVADGSINSPANPVARGQSIAFCLTGQGPVPGAPPDGAAPATALSTPSVPVVFTSAGQLDASDVLYSGLGCGYPGLWQINVMVPNSVAPGTNQIVVLLNDAASNVGAGGAALNVANGTATTFSVK